MSQNGKGSKPRPISNYKIYLNNWSEINWDKEFILCSECGQTYKRDEKFIKMKQDNSGDWVCAGECNFN